MDSLFGHLALRFQNHPENIATEALSYILGKSEIAKKSFLELVGKLNLNVNLSMSFSTQVTCDEQSRPDVVGFNEYGEKPIIIEAKFWAGLTDNQPLAYFQQLPTKNKGLLLFIAPAKRFNTLWPELLERSNTQYQVEDTIKDSEEFWYSRVTGTFFIGLMSWRYLLQFLLSKLEKHGDINRISDVRQLMGLTERMDDLAFIPVRRQELSPELARRYFDFASLVDEVAWKSEELGYCSLKGLRPTGGVGYYGRYIKIGNTGAYLSFDAKNWAHIRNAPLWLTIYGVEWKDKKLSRNALSSYESGEPARAIVVEDEFLISLQLPVGAEKDVVVESIAHQIKDVYELLKDVELRDSVKNT